MPDFVWGHAWRASDLFVSLPLCPPSTPREKENCPYCWSFFFYLILFCFNICASATVIQLTSCEIPESSQHTNTQSGPLGYILKCVQCRKKRGKKISRHVRAYLRHKIRKTHATNPPRLFKRISSQPQACLPTFFYLFKSTSSKKTFRFLSSS